MIQVLQQYVSGFKYRLEHPRSKKQWYDITGKRLARKIMNESLSKGREVLEELNNVEKPVYIIPGNHDFASKKNSDWTYLRINHYLKLINGLNNLVNVHLMLKDIGEFQIIGYGKSSGPELPMYMRIRIS